MFLALDELRKALKADHAYAQSWHDNMACQIMDEGGSHDFANRCAARIMKHCFDVNTQDWRERCASPVAQ